LSLLEPIPVFRGFIAEQFFGFRGSGPISSRLNIAIRLRNCGKRRKRVPAKERNQ